MNWLRRGEDRGRVRIEPRFSVESNAAGAKGARMLELPGMMEVVGVVRDGKVELPASVHLPEGAEVRVIVESEKPYENEPIGEASVLADIAWATGHRFDS